MLRGLRGLTELGDTLASPKISAHGRTEEEDGLQQFRDRQSRAVGVEIAKPTSPGPPGPECC